MKPPRTVIIAVVAVFLLVGNADGMTERNVDRLRSMVENMFYHGYNNYMKHAFPRDELKPMSCTGYNTLGKCVQIRSSNLTL